MDNELDSLDQYIGESKVRFENRRKFRDLNQQDNIDYSNETLFRNLESSIKKNSAFVKRIKVYSESQKAQILDEIDKLNLTKFISEVASSIIEAKLKLCDIPSVIEICTKLNRTYKDFNRNLLDQYSKYFPTVRRKNNETLSSTTQSNSNLSLQANASQHASPVPHSSNLVPKGQNKVVSNEVTKLNPSKLRVDLRLFAELILTGIFPLKDGLPVLLNLLCYLMVYDKCSYQNASAISTLCKGCGDELLGLVPVTIQMLAEKYGKELPSSDLIPPKRQEQLKSHIKEYYHSLEKHLRDVYDELNELVLRSRRVCKSKGEVNKEVKELVEMKHVELQKAQNTVQQMADLLGEKFSPPSDSDSFKVDLGEAGSENDGSAEINLTFIKNYSIWDDDGTKSFYEDLPDLGKLFPSLIIRAGLKKLETPVEDCEKLSRNSEIQSPAKPMQIGSLENDITLDTSSSSEESLVVNDSPLSATAQSTITGINQDILNRTQPEQFFARLSNCVNRDMIDNAVIDFMKFFNTKFGRKKLVKTLFNVQRTRLDLLPFFARLTATIYPYVPSVGNEMVALLKSDFRNLFNKKDQVNIESKVKNVRFIGELTKFGLFPRQESLNCLRLLLSDFTHHHIEMTCNLLETCGRHLFKSTDSHQQLKILLEQMMRKKLLLSVDSKYVTMIENAYYFTNPPDIVRQVVEEPPVHIYVRYLLCECLNRSTIDKVLKQLRKLDWNDKTLTKFVINCMIEAYDLKFYNIRYLAALLAALNKEYPWISTAVIDGVVEDILLMMEINEIQFNQRRIPMIRYFGELYNYRLSDSSLVFKILYSLITYGVHYPTPEQTLTQIPMSQLDLPDNLFRIKLVCDLLETCGQYLNTGQERRKLDCYLLFFQRYYWCKKYIYMMHPYCMAKSGNQFPASVEYLYNDAIYNLRPSFQTATSYSEAIQLVQSFIDGLLVN